MIPWRLREARSRKGEGSRKKHIGDYDGKKDIKIKRRQFRSCT